MRKTVERIIICLILIFLLFHNNGCGKKEDNQSDTIKLEEQTEETNEKEEQQEVQEKNKTILEKNNIYVYVCGAVYSPGVYELTATSRIYEAMEAAGGVTQQGDAAYLNQAQVLTDGQKVYVPTLEETSQLEPNMTIGGSDELRSQTTDGKIDLNKATKEELLTLPGIGESKADSIITYREEHGAFEHIEDIKQITGIKEGVYNKIKDMITV
ncbi:helix-hairpin-helix domain-containing protein [Lachnospiraceae bacterium LCP25S3_G4]